MFCCILVLVLCSSIVLFQLPEGDQNTLHIEFSTLLLQASSYIQREKPADEIIPLHGHCHGDLSVMPKTFTIS